MTQYQDQQDDARYDELLLDTDRQEDEWERRYGRRAQQRNPYREDVPDDALGSDDDDHDLR